MRTTRVKMMAAVMVICFCAGCAPEVRRSQNVAEPKVEGADTIIAEDVAVQTTYLETKESLSTEEVQNAKVSTILVSKEGVEETVPASLYNGDGYSFYLVDGEWRQIPEVVNELYRKPPMWNAVKDDQPLFVSFGITSYENVMQPQVTRILEAQGYQRDQTDERIFGKVRNDSHRDVMYKAMCYESDYDVWVWNTVYYAEADEGWGAEILAMFNTFAVEDGYRVSEHKQKAFMPEGELPKLYPTYTDEVSYQQHVDIHTYYELIISNITDEGFDFTVNSRNNDTGEQKELIPRHTAAYTQDRNSALCMLDADEKIEFDFTDTINTLPIVYCIHVREYEELTGISFVNAQAWIDTLVTYGGNEN